MCFNNDTSKNLRRIIDTFNHTIHVDISTFLSHGMLTCLRYPSQPPTFYRVFLINNQLSTFENIAYKESTII